MTHEVFWDNETKTVLRQEYYDSPTVEEIVEVATKTNEMLKTVSHPVHLIIQQQHRGLRERQAFIKAADQLESHVAPNQGIVIVIDPSIALQFSIKSMALVAPKAATQVHQVHTLEEAREFIQIYQENLKNS